MQVIEVSTPEHKTAFLNVVTDIYKSIKAYVRPLDKDIEGIFDTQKNKYFRHGKATRWILQDDKGKTIGRVAAFVNDKYISQFPGVGGMGFFECIDNRDAAKLLMDTAKNWLVAQGMEAMDGPINFGERDKFWGMTISDYDKSPYYGQAYNPEYYNAFFKDYGFEEYYQQLIFYRKVDDPLQEKFEERAARLSQDKDYEVRTIDKKNLPKLATEFREVYNRSWGKREGDKFVGMSETQAKAITKALKPILDDKLGYFAYFKGTPIGFYIAIPELNAIFKRFKGKFGLWQKLQFLFLIKTGACKTSVGLVFGVDPDHQGKGVEGLMFKVHAQEIQGKNLYHDVIITWIGDFNLKMINIIEALGGRMHQKMATMRYNFDREKPFERHKMGGDHT